MFLIQCFIFVNIIFIFILWNGSTCTFMSWTGLNNEKVARTTGVLTHFQPQLFFSILYFTDIFYPFIT